MSGSLYGVFDDQGLMGNYDFSMPDMTNQSAEVSDSGSAGSSLLSTIYQGIQSIGPTAVAALKTSTDNNIFTKALNAAKASILGDTAAKISQNPTVKAGAKQTAANKIGTWIIDNWQILALAGLGVLGFLIFRRRG